MGLDMIRLWRRLSRYTQGLILIMVSVLFFGWGILGAVQVNNQTTRILAGVQQQFDRAEADRAEGQQLIVDNGNFQTCVWRAIIRPQVIGHEDRAARAIRQCDRRYLDGA